MQEVSLSSCNTV